jgi:hypothetical protein
LIHEAPKLLIDRRRMGEKTYKRRVANSHIRPADILGRSYRIAYAEQLSNRLAKYSGKIFTFLLHSHMAVDNNHAERQIRFSVAMRKNYFENRSTRAAETHAIPMYIFRTCPLRNLDPFSTLADFVAAAIRPDLLR